MVSTVSHGWAAVSGLADVLPQARVAVIDGTDRAPVTNATIVVRDGRIAAVFRGRTFERSLESAIAALTAAGG